MIVETIIAGSSLVVASAIWAGVWLSNKIHARENAFLDPKAEERRILERDRREWLGAFGTPTGKYATEMVAKIDQQLIDLARRKDEDDI